MRGGENERPGNRPWDFQSHRPSIVLLMIKLVLSQIADNSSAN